MIKAIASKLRIDNNENPLAKEFLSYIKDILNKELFQELNNFTQHCNTNRFEHSISVAYYSFLIGKFLKLDAKICARSGLLHDFYLYDRHKIKLEENHLIYHPKVAFKNAKKITTLNKIEEDAILKHMFPICKGIPKYKESYAVTLADKYVSILEVSYQVYKKFTRINFIKKLTSQNLDE